MQLPTVCEPAAQALVVEVQLAPDSDTLPLVQVAVAEPEKPEAVLVAAPVLLWVSAPKEYVQLPTVCEPAAQASVVEVQLAPDSDTVPLVQVAVAEPAKPDAVLVAAPVLLWVSAPKE